MTLNAAKSSIPFGRIKPHPKTWSSAEVEKAVSERGKAFATAHRSDEDRHFPTCFVSDRQGHGRRLALIYCPSLTLNLCTLFFVLSLTHLLPSLICSSPRELASVFADYLRSHFSSSQPKALHSKARGYLSEPCAMRSLTCLFAFSSLPLNFLRLPLISLCPLPLAQTKLPMPR